MFMLVLFILFNELISRMLYASHQTYVFFNCHLLVEINCLQLARKDEASSSLHYSQYEEVFRSYILFSLLYYTIIIINDYYYNRGHTLNLIITHCQV